MHKFYLTLTRFVSILSSLVNETIGSLSTLLTRLTEIVIIVAISAKREYDMIVHGFIAASFK